MPSEVTVNLAQALKWPNRCAHCGSKAALQPAFLHLGAVQNSRLTLTGAVQLKTRLITLRYPVCARHAFGLRFAALLTRQTAVMKAVRACLWIFGLMGLLPTLALPLMLWQGSHSNLPWGAAGICALFTVLMLCLIWARRAQPVQGLRLQGDEATLRFTSSDYRVAFLRANPSATTPA